MLQLALRLLQACCLVFGLYLCKSLLFVYNCWDARRRYAQLKIPGPPPAKTIIGHIPLVANSKGPWRLAELANEYGPVYKFQFMDKLTVVLTDPNTIGRITRKTGPGPYLPKPREMYQNLETGIKPPTVNLVTAEDGPYWKAVRQGAAPCFSAGNLKKVLPLVVELSKRTMDKAAAETAAAVAAGGAPLFDVSDAAKRITSDVMGHMLLGEDLGGTQWKPSEYLDVFYPVLRAQGRMIGNPFYFYQRFWNREVAFQYRCVDKHDQYMNDKVQRMMVSPPADYTIAAHLLSVKDPATGKPLTARQLKAEIAIFMAAGFETTSHAITWCLAVLALHPDIQQQVVDELTSAGLAPAGAPGVRDIDSSDLGKLSYMSAVIKEVLRLCPPAPWGGNKVTVDEDTDIGGYKTPKGTFIFIPLLPYSMARHNYGDGALEVRPDRWLSDAGNSITNMDIGSNTEDPTRVTTTAPGQAPDPYTFMAGPRDCIGQALAKLELQVVLTTVLSKFKVLPGPQLEQELKTATALGQPPVTAIHALAGAHVTLQPEDGTMILRLEPRA